MSLRQILTIAEQLKNDNKVEKALEFFSDIS